MNIIKIEQYENGSHANQFNASVCPSGWAIIPQSMILPQSFPFVDIEVSGNTVISMTEREVPEPEPVEPVPTVEDRLAEAEEEYLKALKGIVKLDLQVLDVVRHIIQRNIDKGLCSEAEDISENASHLMMQSMFAKNILNNELHHLLNLNSADNVCSLLHAF